MSFSSQVKEELSKINNLANKKLVRAELNGYLASSNATVISTGKIKYSTESEYNINRFSKLLNNVEILNYKIDIQGKTFVITFEVNSIDNIMNIEDGKLYICDIDENEESVKALSRGIFLGSGSINNPENKYHLEISLSNQKNAEFVYDIMKKFGITLKKIKSKNAFSLYLKDGEETSKFLAFIGANKAVLDFEEVRVKRDMNNKINRIVNCESANLNKTINAAVTQIEAIKYLKETKQFDKLDDTLKEIANVRLENPELPLSELGGLLKEPIGKSGANYRLKKIVDIAKNN
jgi:hypothetical protein